VALYSVFDYAECTIGKQKAVVQPKDTEDAKRKLELQKKKGRCLLGKWGGLLMSFSEKCCF
jgi:hypothetical protein